MLGVTGAAPGLPSNPFQNPRQIQRQSDGLKAFRAWLAREHPGYRSDEGPAPFRHPAVSAAFPGRRFYYVLTYPRGIGIAPNALTLVAQVDDRGAVRPLDLRSPTAFRLGLRRVVTAKDATRAAEAVLILALGDPATRRWKFEEARFAVQRTADGWVCVYDHGANHKSRVTFDKDGALLTIDPQPPGVP